MDLNVNMHKPIGTSSVGSNDSITGVSMTQSEEPLVIESGDSVVDESNNEKVDSVSLSDNNLATDEIDSLIFNENALSPEELADVAKKKIKAGKNATPPSPKVMIKIDRLLGKYAGKYGLPLEKVRAVAWQESKWNPKATSWDGGHGKGVFQIDDRFHELAKTSKVWNPEKNIDYGCKYLKKLLKNNKGNWTKTLKDYNGGWDYPNLIFKWEKQKPWHKYF